MNKEPQQAVMIRSKLRNKFLKSRSFKWQKRICDALHDFVPCCCCWFTMMCWFTKKNKKILFKFECKNIVDKKFWKTAKTFLTGQVVSKKKIFNCTRQNDY